MEITLEVEFTIIDTEAYYIITVINEETQEIIKTHKRNARYYRSAINAGDKVADNYVEKGYLINDIRETRS